MSPRKTALGDPTTPINSTFALKLIGVLLAAALALSGYIWRSHTATVQGLIAEEKDTHTKLWQKYGDVQGRQAEQATELRALNVETGYIKGEVDKANTKLDRLLEPRGR